MNKTLPTNPDINQLRRQAKELLRDARAGDGAALARLKRPDDQADRAPKPHRPDRPILADAQRAIARELGFASWPRLRDQVAAASAAATRSSREPRAAQPLFADKAQSGDALFTAAGFLERAQDAGWAPGPLPDAIVFTFHPIYAQLLDDDARFERNTRLAPGNATMFTTIDQDRLRVGVTCLSPGATAMIGQVENQVALNGATRFLIVGSAGSINADIEPGTVVVVDSAVRDDGISQHYLPADTHVDADADLITALRAALDERDLPAETATTWTVPTPYRSTRNEVEQLSADGVAVVECEVASLLAVAEALGVSAGACLSVTSSLVGHETGPASLRPPAPGQILDSALAALGC